MESPNEQLLVFTDGPSFDSAGRVERRVPSLLKGGLRSIEVSTLKKNMTVFFDQLREILDSGAAEFSSFEVNKVEISAQITADGKIALLGSGGQIGVEGGIRFVLQKKGSSCATPTSISG